MGAERRNFNRRTLLINSSSLIAGAVVAGASSRLLAETSRVLDVASAGSIRPMMDGPLKDLAARSLSLDLHSHAQGADLVAQSIVDGSLHADVFISITKGPMLTVMRSGKAEVAQPIARTEMVIMYSPKSRFAPRLDAASEGKANWWEILQEPGFRFARGNPAGDPGARSIIFTMMLAAKKYKQSNFVDKVLGSPLNPEQVFSGGNNQARLQSGELDAIPAYKIAPASAKLPYIVLPEDINLSDQNVQAEHPDVSLSIEGKTYRPEPLVFYAAVLRGAANPNGAAAFSDWLRGNDAQAIFRQYQYGPPGDASALHA